MSAFARSAVGLGLASLLLSGCVYKSGDFAREHVTNVELSRANYKYITTVEGTDSGVRVFGIFGSDPTFAEAMNEVRSKAELRARVNMPGPSARAFVNITCDESNAFWVLFTLKRIRLSADVIEFIPDGELARGK